MPTLYRIADIVFLISTEHLAEVFRLEASYRDFACAGEPDVIIRVQYGAEPQISLRDADEVFDSEGVWSLYRADGQNVFLFKSPRYGPHPYRMAVFDADFRQGQVYLGLSEVHGQGHDLGFFPLEFPLSEVLMVCLLAQGQGLMLHACGIDDGGQGFLFAGNSTHGKTTTAELWRERAAILNDDRIVLRQREGRFWMYGTPWHGEYSKVSPHGVPLDRIFFLQHAEANRARRVAGAEATSMLLARCFPPLWDAAGMGFTLDFCAQLAEAVPCYELGFVPDKSAVEYVRCVP